VESASTEKKWRTFGRKYLGKKVQQVQKLTGSKTSTNKIPVWSGGHRGTKNNIQMESS
jgi:hypothetical protein